MTPSEQRKLYNFLKEYAFQIRINGNSNPLSKKILKYEDVPNITYLHFWNKGLESLIDEIGLLVKLKGLILTKNKLSFLPNSFSNLVLLEELDLSENSFLEFPMSIINLSQLEDLRLDTNRLEFLPPEIINFNFNKHIVESWIKGNDFIKPSAEIISGGLEAIKVYFNDMQDELSQVNEIKVLFVGDGGAGKTSLINKIIFDEFNSEEKKTNGIVKQEYKFNNVTANFWDFGGQTIYHSTHQFFLSKRSIYILVLDGRKEQEEEYWLKMIENFGDESEVFIVLNKIDDNKQASLDEKVLRNKYPNIIDFFKVSCLSDEGIDNLKNKLQETIMDSSIIKEMMPKSWFDTKEHVEKMDNDFLNYELFEEICNKNKVKNESQKVLTTFLHDLGVILNFGENYKLKDTHIINPDWATEGVYNIINSEELSDKEGLLNTNNLENILDIKKYPREKHIYLIELMKKFELCFEKDTKYILIPELLPKNEPAFNFTRADEIRFRIRYDFLPKASITRFIVNEHNLICDGLVWRKGIVLEDKEFDTKAIIREDKVEKFIDIIVFGEYKRELLSKIRTTFGKINKNFQSNKIIEKVLLPDNDKIEIEFEHLLFLEQENESTFIPQGAKKRYEVSQLLDGFIKKDERKGIIVDKYINGDNYENVEQNNQTSGSIGGDNVTHNNESKELLELIKLIDESELEGKDEIIEELRFNQDDKEQLPIILGSLMSRSAELVTLAPAITSVLKSIFLA